MKNENRKKNNSHEIDRKKNGPAVINLLQVCAHNAIQYSSSSLFIF